MTPWRCPSCGALVRYEGYDRRGASSPAALRPELTHRIERDRHDTHEEQLGKRNRCGHHRLLSVASRNAENQNDRGQHEEKHWNRERTNLVERGPVGISH
jgi:hypothetical protein